MSMIGSSTVKSCISRLKIGSEFDGDNYRTLATAAVSRNFHAVA